MNSFAKDRWTFLNCDSSLLIGRHRLFLWQPTHSRRDMFSNLGISRASTCENDLRASAFGDPAAEGSNRMNLKIETREGRTDIHNEISHEEGLVGCITTAHQNLDGTFSLADGPHCRGRYDNAGLPLTAKASAHLSRGQGNCLFCPPRPTRPTSEGTTLKPDISFATKTGHLHLLRTALLSEPVSSGQRRSERGQRERRHRFDVRGEEATLHSSPRPQSLLDFLPSRIARVLPNWKH